MSDILVKIGGVVGESNLAKYEGQIECVAMRHVIDLPVVAKDSTRTEGASRHGAVELAHTLDSASPALRFAASAGTNLGEATITRMRTIGGEAKPAEIITLKNAYVVRVDTVTPVDEKTGAPDQEPMEYFSVEYSEIRWDHKCYENGAETGSVQGSWSTATQSIV